MGPVLLAIAVFLVMEPVTAVIHRLVMHGGGWGWHRSHHQPATGRFERNDLYPVVFAAITIAGLCIGVFGGVAVLVPVGIGVTAYGVAYTLLHDVAIHRRVSIPVPSRLVEPWRRAHAVHHRFNDAPYGFLAPVVPKRLRERDAERPTTADPVARPMGQVRDR
jgi:beta-carotene 3-hydroxylase